MLNYFPIRTVSNKQLGAAGGNTLLGTVNVGTGAATAVLKLYDGVDATGTLVSSIDASAKGSYAFFVRCPKGLFVDLSGGTADCTIGYA